MKFFKKYLFSLLALIVLANLSYSQNTSSTIAFLSDTQAPMGIEKLWLKSHQNEQATAFLFNQIKNEHPTALFILGDVVNLSCKNNRWQKIDTYLVACRNMGIKIYGALGNHEVLGNATKGEQNFQLRFPENNKTGYVEIIDSIAVMLLNSNHKNLSATEMELQNRWYKNKLTQLDADSTIKFIIVGCHHSPYSNSKIVGSSKWVQENFVIPFIQSKKCKLFLSGHAHVFEYFKMKGKDFMVIGGGGGLHHPLNKNENAFKSETPNYNPLFHYLTVNLLNGRLQIISHQLKNDFIGFENRLIAEL
jgi:UDP-2,3-diacylglucosamine pyrophosphatase LpxH